MDTRNVGESLVGFCRKGQFLDAIDALYGDDIVSVEAQGSPEYPAEERGIDAIRSKNERWAENNEVHSVSAEGPMVNGDRFSVIYDFDVTPKTGQRAGQRFQMREVALYTVSNGRIVREEFFY